MPKRLLTCVVMVTSLGVLAFAQLTNDSITKMVKAGLGDEVVISTIQASAAQYSTTPDDLIALKTAGVGDKVIAAMVSKMSAGGAAPAPALSPAAAAAQGPVSEVGVYFKKNDVWADLAPEVVNFKTGGVLKNIGTAGLVKGDINGHLNGAHSKNMLKTPVMLLVYTSEGVAITEYQLLRLREQQDSREFRTVTGGVLHVSGGQTRDALPFEGKKIAPRTYEISLPNIGNGDFGLLPPATSDSTGSSGRLGKIYSFRVLE